MPTPAGPRPLVVATRVAIGATVHVFLIELSDVDRGVYTELELRVARHPSETLRYLLLRVLAFALSHEEGLAFSREGIASTDEPPLAVRDLTGALVAWIEIGAPSAERLHRAAKAARRVELWSAADPVMLRREAASRPIHRLGEIVVRHVAPAFLDALEPHVARHTRLALLRNEGGLWITVGGQTIEGAVTALSLAEPGP